MGGTAHTEGARRIDCGQAMHPNGKQQITSSSNFGGEGGLGERCQVLRALGETSKGCCLPACEQLAMSVPMGCGDSVRGSFFFGSVLLQRGGGMGDSEGGALRVREAA